MVGSLNLTSRDVLKHCMFATIPTSFVTDAAFQRFSFNTAMSFVHKHMSVVLASVVGCWQTYVACGDSVVCSPEVSGEMHDVVCWKTLVVCADSVGCSPQVSVKKNDVICAETYVAGAHHSHVVEPTLLSI